MSCFLCFFLFVLSVCRGVGPKEISFLYFSFISDVLCGASASTARRRRGTLLTDPEHLLGSLPVPIDRIRQASLSTSPGTRLCLCEYACLGPFPLPILELDLLPNALASEAPRYRPGSATALRGIRETRCGFSTFPLGAPIGKLAFPQG